MFHLMPYRFLPDEFEQRRRGRTRIAWWLALRPLWFAAGALALVLVAVLLVPDNPVLALRQHRTLGMVLSHAGMLCLALGCYPARHRWLGAIARLTSPRRTLALALGTVAPVAVLGLVALAWPRYARELLRESGPVEALQTVLLLVAAWVASELARRRRSRGLEHRPYRLLAAGALLLILEEIDYFGVFGGLLGRVGGVHVGSFHDLLNLAEHYPIVWLGLGAAALALGITLWRQGYLPAAVVRAEARDVTTVPFYLALLAAGTGELADVSGQVMASLGGLFVYRVEEPFELLAALLLNVSVVLKYARDRGPESPDASREAFLG